MTVHRLTPLLAGLGLVAASTAYAQTAPADLTLQAVIPSGLTQPLSIRAPNDGSGRLFILEKTGAIRIFKPGIGLNATPFLTVPVSSSSEQGLLGLAFHPQFASNGRFYVQHTRAPGGSNLGSTADQLTVEYTVSAGNADIADAASRKEILRVADLAGNHNGGDIQFGNDGYLYISMGDGGPQYDANRVAQCQWRKPTGAANPCAIGAGTNYALLGKILRIDIDNTTTLPAGPSELCGTAATLSVQTTVNYAIPASNPNVASSNTCDEIWHYGMRNPWRFSFDRQTHDMIVADVGQDAYEEVSFIAAGTSGVNLGWSGCEGLFAFNAAGQTVTSNPCTFGTTPILAYPRSLGNSITGGYRYRGAITELRGMYIFGDYGSGRIFFAKPDAGSATGWSMVTWQDTTMGIAGFGEDANGEIYLADLNGGAVHKFVSPSANDGVFANGFE